MRGSRFVELDGVRAVGALAVLATHVGFVSGASLNGPLSAVVTRLDIGVALFFVVSGFLLHRPHVAATLDGDPPPPGRWREYAGRRALRILPAYWIALLLAALVVPEARGTGTGTWVLHAVLAQVYDGTPQVLGLAQTWSLSTEAAFYVLLPLLVIRLTRPGSVRSVRRRHRWLLLTVVLGPAWQAASTAAGAHAEAGLWLPGYLGWFAAGMVLACRREALLRGARRPDAIDRLAGLPAHCLAAAALVYLLACTPLAGPQDLSPAGAFEASAKNVLYLLVAVLVVLPFVARPGSAGVWHVVLRSAPITLLGRISYGVFLYHLPLLFLIQRATGHDIFSGGFWWLLAATLAATLPLAWLSYTLVERPASDLGGRPPVPAATATPARATATRT